VEIFIDLVNQQGDFDPQEDVWTIGHSVLTDEARIELIEAKQAKKSIEVSVLYWEGTEHRCRGMVERIAPKFVVRLTKPAWLANAPRRRAFDSAGRRYTDD
jgi:hypothetical protein